MSDVAYIRYVSGMLLKTVTPCLFIFGCLGNIMSIIVLTRPESRKQSTAVYLTSLSFCDLLTLCVGMPRLWLRGLSGYDIRILGDVMCKVHSYLTYVTTQCSSWLIVAVTLERVITVWYPLRVRIGCTVRSAFIAVLAVVGVIAASDSHIIFIFRVVTDPSNNTACGPGIEAEYFYYKVWPWIDLVLLFLVPFLILSIGNILIIIKVRQSRVFRGRSGVTIITPTSSSQSQEPMYFLTAMLVTLNVVFLVLVSPIAAFMISQCGLLPDDSVINKEKEIAVCDLIWNVVSLLVYMNYSVNFILYMVCGARFRSELKNALWPCRRERTPSSHTINVTLSVL